jgi:hypothetical protein
MPKSTTAYINFGRALPKGEPLAGLMGRLFVVLADLLIERDELGGDFEPGKLGDPEIQYRYLYFMRSSSLTLHDGRLLLGAFESSKQFRDCLHADPLLYEEWKKAKKTVDQAGAKLEWVRNRIGAHIGKSIEDGVRAIDGATEGKLEIGADGWLRPHLAQIILLSALAPLESTEEWEKNVQEIAATMADAIVPMISALQVAFTLYRKQYPSIWG